MVVVDVGVGVFTFSTVVVGVSRGAAVDVGSALTLLFTAALGAVVAECAVVAVNTDVGVTFCGAVVCGINVIEGNVEPVGMINPVAYEVVGPMLTTVLLSAGAVVAVVCGIIGKALVGMGDLFNPVA